MMNKEGINELRKIFEQNNKKVEKKQKEKSKKEKEEKNILEKKGIKIMNLPNIKINTINNTNIKIIDNTKDDEIKNNEKIINDYNAKTNIKITNNNKILFIFIKRFNDIFTISRRTWLFRFFKYFIIIWYFYVCF